MDELKNKMDELKNKVPTNIIIAIILVVGIVISSAIVTNGIVDIKTSRTNIVVTGSAKQQITSDLIVWTGVFNTQSEKLQTAYTKLEESREKVRKYLLNKGLTEDQLVFSSINTTVNYVI